MLHWVQSPAALSTRFLYTDMWTNSCGDCTTQSTVTIYPKEICLQQILKTWPEREWLQIKQILERSGISDHLFACLYDSEFVLCIILTVRLIIWQWGDWDSDLSSALLAVITRIRADTAAAAAVRLVYSWRAVDRIIRLKYTLFLSQLPLRFQKADIWFPALVWWVS